MKQRNYFVVSIFLTVVAHAVSSQVIPAARTTDWTVAGYNGTIPVYPIVKNITDYGGSGNAVTANDMALQNAINSLNSQNGIIYFPAGTFLFNATISLRSGLVLKGAGAANTLLKFNLSGSGNLIAVSGSVTADSANIVSAAAKGATTVMVDNAGLFHVNDPIKIYQNDAALVNDSWAVGSVGQLLRIENITGNSISFSNALRRTYPLGSYAEIRRISMVTGVGIECLKIKRMDATVSQTANIFFSNAANCWVKGVESDSCNFAHIQVSNSSNIEITHNYFHGAFAYGAGGQGYGISCEYSSGECLVENNVFKHLRHSMLLQSGANGNVFDYNYSIEPFKTDSLPFDLSGDIVLHGNYPYLNLFEGNIVQNMVVDASHGVNGPYNTFLRNRAASYGLLVSPGAGDSTNIVGNEISGTGFQKGNYFVQGLGMFEYGNNKNDTIIPLESAVLSDKSYYYASTPAFWNVSSLWPSVGINNAIRTGTIPAKERYAAGIDICYCLPLVPVIYRFTGNGNWNVAANWENNLPPPAVLPGGSEIIIDPAAGGKCILNVPYTLPPIATFTIRPGKQFEVLANLILVH